MPTQCAISVSQSTASKAVPRSTKIKMAQLPEAANRLLPSEGQIRCCEMPLNLTLERTESFEKAANSCNAWDQVRD